jgi:hypothetical protein
MTKLFLPYERGRLEQEVKSGKCRNPDARRSIETLNGKTETLNGRLKIAELKFKKLTKKPYKK